MSEEILVRNCSPTLAGIKTGSLFSCKYENIEELKTAIIKFNHRLVKKGLRIIPLLYRESSVLIYVYRPRKLENDLKEMQAKEILRSYDYPFEKPSACLAHLVERLKMGDGFPHEIGLFLGYPPEDVFGFIENKATRFKFIGTWKVYGDEERARCLFSKYKKCTDVYMRTFLKGSTIERLTVSVS